VLSINISKIIFEKLEASVAHSAPFLAIGLILAFLLVAVAYGIYITFGPGAKNLTDSIDEHARMHELGIAHGHGEKDGRY
tara:strand:+ start:382 stop:621 length:240 start_codon:yes stop_codon:yes gene_type:complete